MCLAFSICLLSLSASDIVAKFIKRQKGNDKTIKVESLLVR